MVDVWGSFARGAQIGGALREASERRQREQAYGQAFDQGGWGAVAKQAGSMGDLDTATGIQAHQSEQEERAYDRAVRNATVLGNAATSLMGVPYEQRGARLQQMAPMLEQMGLDPQQIAAFDPTDEALSGIRAIQGQFSQYVDIRQQGDAIVGIRADGSTEVLRQEESPAPRGYQWNQDRSAVSRIPGYQPSGGDAQYRPMTAEEAPQWGLEDPSGWMMTPQGEPEPVGGAAGLRQRTTAGRAERARMEALYQQTVSNQVVLRDIQRARELAPRGAGISSLAAVIPGTDAANLSALVDTIGANIGFDRLQQMRDSSPTGGALGQVTERELALLQAVLASLKQSQSDEQFVQNLDNLERQYRASMQRIALAYEQDFGQAPPAAPGPGEGVGGDIGTLINRQRNAPQAGAGQAPEGLSQEEWNVMTPEERALWQN